MKGFTLSLSLEENYLLNGECAFLFQLLKRCHLQAVLLFKEYV